MMRAVVTSAAALLLLAVSIDAQDRAPKATVRSLVGSEGVHAGTSVHVALEVELPDGIHVQADKPRDPLLIPTALTVTAPTGVTVTEIVYPQATDFAQAGQQEPLAVFEQRFVIGATLAFAPAFAEGETAVPARLRYQACNAATCFAPARAEARWLIRVVPGAVPTPDRFVSIFSGIRFRR